MLDNKNVEYNILKIDASLNLSDKITAIMPSRCCIYQSKDIPYSELEYCSVCAINSNNGYEDINIEIELANADKYFYNDYFINCIALRTEDKVIIKSSWPSAKKGVCKITKNGQFTMNIRYYLNSADELKDIMKSNKFVLEFAVAIKNPRNVYQISCLFTKNKNGWEIERGNTYRLYKCKHIDSYAH